MNNDTPPLQPDYQAPQQDHTNSATFQTLIPTQNKPALIGYYCGVFGLLPFVGLPLAIIAVILGILGLKQYKRNPTPGAKGHALTALILGIFEIVCFVLFIAVVIIASKS